MKLHLNGSKEGFSVVECTENLRKDSALGIIKELLINLAVNMEDIEHLAVDDFTINQVEIFDGDNLLFSSNKYTELINITNTIGNTKRVFMTIR